MRNTQPPRKPLSDLEHRVMRFLWSRESATAEQVRDALASHKPLKDSTVRTVLRRLEEKGYACHGVEGRTYVYRGLEKPENVALSAVRQIIDRFCGGSAEALVAGMVENESLGGEELEQLARKLRASRGRKEPAK